MLRLLLGIFSPLVKLLGVSALTDAMDILKRQFDAIEARQKGIEERLGEVEKRNRLMYENVDRMVRARMAAPHADAAPPRLPGESIDAYARRLLGEAQEEPKKQERRRPKAANVEGEGDEPPPEHV